MALRDNGDGVTVDPEDSSALAAWTAQRAALLRSLDAAQRRVATLDAILASPEAGATEQEAAAAHAALDQARAAAAEAQDRADAADAEAHRFEANELATAVANAEDATRAVSEALAELLRDSSVSASLTATVDGLVLRERYRVAIASTPPAWDHTTIPFPSGPGDVIDPELTLPTVDPAEGSDYRRLLAVLDRLDQRVDAVADLTAAESVHQLVAGNPVRSGGSLAVAAEGRVPDELDVIRTPRPGHDVVHRLVALTDPAAPAPWTVPRPGPAAVLDPVAAAWAASLLPDPARVQVRVRLLPFVGAAASAGTGGPADGGDGPGGPADGGIELSARAGDAALAAGTGPIEGPGGPDATTAALAPDPGGTGETPPIITPPVVIIDGGDGTDDPATDAPPDLAEPVEVPLSALGLDALGWVRVAAGGPELDQRLARAAEAARRAGGETPPPGRAVVDDTASVGAGGLADLLAAARATGRVLSASRALDPADLAHPAAADAPPPPPAAADRVVQRVRKVETWVDALAGDLEAAATGTATTFDPDALVGRLLDAASAGVAEALPPPDGPAVPDAALLRSLAAAAAARLRLRHATAPVAADPQDPAGTLRRARARADELVGMRLPLSAELAPPLDATATGDLAAGAHRLGGADPATARAWLLDHARVRPAVRALVEALDLAEVLDAAAVLDPRVTQLPTATPDIWAGATPTPPPGKVSIVVQAGYGARLPATVAGLVVDGWSQPVGGDGHDSGLAFHYDQPDAAPPQAVLVAVHPDPGPGRTAASWDLDTLLDVVTSTFALARDRATAAERARTSGIEIPDV